MSKIRVNQVETLDASNTVNVSDIVDGSSIITATGTQTLVASLDSRVLHIDTITDLLGLSSTAAETEPAVVVNKAENLLLNGVYKYESARAKSEHDGISILDPDKVGDIGTHAFYTPPGIGTGCWVYSSSPSPLFEDETVTVGPSGDFPTINLALRYFSFFRPVFDRSVSESTTDGVMAHISLDSDYIAQEQIVLKNIDLSWVEIVEGADVVYTIDRSSLTQLTPRRGGESTFAFITAVAAGLPLIRARFQMDTSGTAAGRWGLVLRDHAWGNVRQGPFKRAGFLNCGDRAIYVAYGSKLLFWDSMISGSAGGIECRHQAEFHAREMTGDDLGGIAVLAYGNSKVFIRSSSLQRASGNAMNITGSTCYFWGTDFSDSGGTFAALIRDASHVDADEATFSGAAGTISVEEGSTFGFSSGLALNMGDTALRAVGGSRVSAGSSDLSGSVQGILVSSGSSVDASAANLSNMTGAYYVRAQRGGNLTIALCNVSGTEPTGSKVEAVEGGIIYSHGTGGSRNISRNSLTVDGIIFSDIA